MKKQESHNYIDKEKKILRTANNLYEESLKEINLIPAMEKECSAEKVAEFYKMIEYNLKDSLLFGKEEAAAGLAYLHRGGLGGETNEHNYKLFMLVGSKLGNEKCTSRIQGDYSDVEQEANAWVKTIETIAQKYLDKDKEITTAMAVTAQDKLSENLKDISQEFNKNTTDEHDTTDAHQVEINFSSTYAIVESASISSPVDPIGEGTQDSKCCGCELS